VQQAFRARTTKIAAYGAMLFVVAALALPGAARAEGGLFGAIAHMLQRAVSPPTPARNSDTSDAPSTSLLDVFGAGQKAEVKPSEGGPKVAYCVRSCDGRYFPMAKNSGAVTPGQVCESMCPAAQTEVYSGSTIENAVSHKGAKYSALVNAYLYREKLVESCTCNGKATGNASINYQNDPTLRPGDIVMTEDGPVVFKGAIAPTHKLSDFVPVRDSKRVSSRTREKVIAMKLMPTRQAQTQTRKNVIATNAPNATEAIKSLPASSTKALGYAD
jgi:hypothetical protein